MSFSPSHHAARMFTLLALAGSTGALHAATFTVGSEAGCTHATIQAALDAARVNGAGEDEIRIREGTWLGQNLWLAGSSVILSGGWNGCGAGAQRTGSSTLSAGSSLGTHGANRVLRVEQANSPIDVTLRHLVIRDGRDAASSDGGGGIRATGRVQLYLENVEVTRNASVADGGGVFVQGASSNAPALLEIRANVHIADNEAFSHGGGIQATDANVYVRSDRTRISGNRAFFGGGIAARAARVVFGAVGTPVPYVTTSGASIDSNQAAYGGGIHVRDNTLFDARELRIVDNTASENGGGVHATGGSQVQFSRDYPTAMQVRCADSSCSMFKGNQAGDGCPGTRGTGGAAYFDGAAGYFSQVEFVRNCAWGSPAIFTWGTRMYLDGVLFTQQRLRFRDNGDRTSRQVVTYGRRAGDPDAQSYLGFVTFADNVEVKGDGTTLPAQATSVDIFGTWHHTVTALVTADPILLDVPGACNVVGATAWDFVNAAARDYRPSLGGRLIDACPRNAVTIEYTDPRLQVRCQDHPGIDQGGTCDIGAYELPAPPADRIFASGFE
ncbi:hypothetical protein ACQQ2N_17785 [Dokdonella sp. MW10]|uniref:hypothetical protein n=1 Tax=Dokdonella sp. MW10 TaxID=2992926 RepID=UPI003F7E59B5